MQEKASSYPSASAERNIRIERLSGKTGVLSIMRNLAKLANFAGGVERQKALAAKNTKRHEKENELVWRSLIFLFLCLFVFFAAIPPPFSFLIPCGMPLEL